MPKGIPQYIEDQVPINVNHHVKEKIRAHLLRRESEKYKPWTPEDEQQLREHYKDNWITVYEIAEKLDRSTYSIMSKASRLGITKAIVGGLDPRK